MSRSIALLACALFGAGCAVQSPSPVPSDHPASIDASSSVMPGLSQTLSTPSESAHESSNDRSNESMKAMPGMNHAMPSSEHPTTAASGMFVCPMHAEVTSYEPGKCPKCGMALVKRADNNGGHSGH